MHVQAFSCISSISFPCQTLFPAFNLHFLKSSCRYASFLSRLECFSSQYSQEFFPCLKNTSKEQIPFIRNFSNPNVVEWKDHYVKRPDMNIHFLKSQSNAHSSLPILVFLHGLSVNGPFNIPVLKYLSNDFNLVLPDARGHGKSQCMPKGSFSMDALIEDAMAVIQTVSPDSKVFLSGHSMGAATAARLAKRYPSRIRALLLVDPPWTRLPTEPINPNLEVSRTVFGNAKKIQSMSEKEFLLYDLEAGELIRPEMTEPEALRLLDLNVEDTFRSTDDEINEAVVGLEMPTCLQTGDVASGSVLSPGRALAAVSTWETGKIVHFPEAGHVIHMERKQREKWLQSVRVFFQLQMH